MADRTYIAIVEQAPGEAAWSIAFPDFPEIASVAETAEDIPVQALDALRTAIDARAEDGEAIPDATSADALANAPLANRPDDAAPDGVRLLVLVTAEIPGKPVRVNISIDQALLERIDAAARQRGLTRSGLLADAARASLRG